VIIVVDGDETPLMGRLVRDTESGYRGSKKVLLFHLRRCGGIYYHLVRRLVVDRDHVRSSRDSRSSGAAVETTRLSCRSS